MEREPLALHFHLRPRRTLWTRACALGAGFLLPVVKPVTWTALGTRGTSSDTSGNDTSGTSGTSGTTSSQLACRPYGRCWVWSVDSLRRLGQARFSVLLGLYSRERRALRPCVM
eukprot:8043168-Pyramimonas_sp.AAC.1